MVSVFDAREAPVLGGAPALSVVDMVWPDQSNHHGTLFGGAALSMLDRLAFIQGSRVLRGTVVTASVGRLDFARPVPAGHAVECQARIVRQGVRSVTLDVRLRSEDLLTGEQGSCLSGEFVMVRKAEGEPGHEAVARQALDDDPDTPWHRPAPGTVSVAEIVFPGHANHRGMLHGGPAMAWIAKAGFVAATRQVRRSVVMARSEQLDFAAPAWVGDVVEVQARVVSVGQRSVRVEVNMWAESPTTGQHRLCTKVGLVYVALKE